MKQMTPLVSIIIPVYNVEDYLRECLDSLVNQTYKNIEIIVIDDGSTDNSSDILAEYTQPFVKTFTQSNAGQSAARNLGIDYATGKYVLFIDSDDYILEETIEELVSSMEKNQLDLIRFSAEPFSDNVDYKIYNKQYDFSKHFSENTVYNNEQFLKISANAYSTSPCLYMTKLEIIKDYKLKFVEGILHEDELFTLELFFNVDRASYTNKQYYKRRYRSGSVMTTSKNTNKLKSFDSYTIVLDRFLELEKHYKKDYEHDLIRKRKGLLFGIISYYDLDDKEYKDNTLKNIKGFTNIEKKYFSGKYRVKMVLKRIYFFLKR